MESDDLVGNVEALGEEMHRHHTELAAKHPSVGRYRNLGLFGIVELVKDRTTMEPLSPFNVLNDTMATVNKALLDRGLFTMVRFNGIMTNPPLSITAEQLDDGFAIIDEVLDIADRAVRVAGLTDGPARRPSVRPMRRARPSRRSGPDPRSVRP